MKTKNVNKKIDIKTTIKGFFKHWLNFLKPFHDVTEKEIDVLHLLLFYYAKYAQDTKNVNIINKMVFNYETKLAIRKELNIKDQSLQNVLTSLRKKKVIINNQINRAYVPLYSLNTKKYEITFNFLINGQKTVKKN